MRWIETVQLRLCYSDATLKLRLGLVTLEILPRYKLRKHSIRFLTTRALILASKRM